MYSIIAQPHHAYRVGDFLSENLAEPKWTQFRASVAFVKKSGTQYIQEALAEFAASRGVNISVGLDHGGSSVEGFNQILNAVKPNGQLWVYKNSANTYHPKVYMFRNATHADIVIGSGNLTKGGLYENAEMGVRLQLDLMKAADVALIKELEATLDLWSTAQPRRCIAVDAALILELNAAGELPTEAEAAVAILASKSTKSARPGRKPSPFNSSAIPSAPHLTPSPARARAPMTPLPATNIPTKNRSIPVAVPTIVVSPLVARSSLKFVMTLQNTDVGVGQTHTGTSKRSPEIFIPIGALDLEPSFWGWTSKFVPDGAKYKPDLAWRIANAAWIAKKLASNRQVPRPVDKLDWEHVKVNLVGHNGLLDVAFWFNPGKIDIRLRESSLRSAGDVDDILAIAHAPQGANYDYDMEVVHKADRRYPALYAHLTQKAPGQSLKKYGYF